MEKTKRMLSLVLAVLLLAASAWNLAADSYAHIDHTAYLYGRIPAESEQTAETSDTGICLLSEDGQNILLGALDGTVMLDLSAEGIDPETIEIDIAENGRGTDTHGVADGAGTDTHGVADGAGTDTHGVADGAGTDTHGAADGAGTDTHGAADRAGIHVRRAAGGAGIHVRRGERKSNTEKWERCAACSVSGGTLRADSR